MLDIRLLSYPKVATEVIRQEREESANVTDGCNGSQREELPNLKKKSKESQPASLQDGAFALKRGSDASLANMISVPCEWPT